MEITTSSPQLTEKVGFILAQEALKQKKPLVIALKGNLGSGKTTLTKGFAKGLGIKEKITSPTFNIFKSFDFNNQGKLYHFDCYRIKNNKEISLLGFKEISSNPQNIVLVEWPEKIKMPKEHLVVEISFIGEKERKIIIRE